MESLLTALEAYRAEGGEGLIFVNDDGLQLIDKFERYALQCTSAGPPFTDLQEHNLSCP